MDLRALTTSVLAALGAILLLASPAEARTAIAYIGPGAGVTAVGAFLALVAGIVVALLGFVWYPIRRLRKKLKRSRREPEPAETPEDCGQPS